METKNRETISYPYIPKDKIFIYVPENNKYMSSAREIALTQSTDKKVPTGVVVVNERGNILVSAANQSVIKNKFLLDTHKNWCIRKLLKIPTGQKYWLCPGCASSKYHAESLAVEKAKKLGVNISGCDLYLWGHWWCCRQCWDRMIEAGIKDVYLTSRD